MMMKTLLISAAAAMTLGGAVVAASVPASAQVGIEIGPSGPRVYDDRYRPVVERRVERRRVIVEEDDGPDCRIEVERRVNRFGERVTRRTKICD
jgi:hypothetical protein